MTNYDVLLEKVRELGMDYKWASMFVKKLRDDENAFPVEDEEKKKWALEKGFYPGRIELYGLTEENYMDYVPDYQYFMLHPMNNHFLKWLDKTTLKYVLNSNGCEDVMPKYYAYVENDLCGGRYTYLMDCPTDIPKNEGFLWNLLQKEKFLMLKPNSGSSGGMGVIKMELRGENLFENNKPIDKVRFEEIRDTMRNYIITEYAHQHHELAEVWPDSECTLRVIMCKDPTEDKYAPARWTNVVSFARFGTKLSGGASNLSAGGVGIGFDFETGEYNNTGVRYRRFCNDGSWSINQHPDTEFIWKGKSMPNWPYVKKKIIDICQHMSSLDYLGFDIIVTEDGMKLCEINSHAALDYSQVMSGAALSRPKTKAFFEYKGLRDFDAKSLYKAYMESQE